MTRSNFRLLQCLTDDVALIATFAFVKCGPLAHQIAPRLPNCHFGHTLNNLRVYFSHAHNLVEYLSGIGGKWSI